MEALLENPVFSAGFGLIGVGTALAVGRQACIHAAIFTKRQLVTSLEITSRDKAYAWILHWLQGEQRRQQLAAQAGREATWAWWRRSSQLGVQTLYRPRENGSADTSFQLLPGTGRHYLMYKNTILYVDRVRERSITDGQSGIPFETITLTAFTRSYKLFHDMLAEAHALGSKEEEGKTVIFTSRGPEWRPLGRPRTKRALQSVVLQDDLVDRIHQDVLRFIKDQQWYLERGDLPKLSLSKGMTQEKVGVPYRRGYLLHGPPGSGKTSFIQALAAALDYNICVLNLSERGMTDDRLAHLLTIVPPQSLLLLEDIDAAFGSRQAERNQAEKDNIPPAYQSLPTMLTFSGLLNALDGVAASEERLLFMTTNHVDRLDPALIRPGRVDVKEYIGWATPTQMKTMFSRFYNDTAGADRFTDRFANKEVKISPAALQGHFILYKDSPEEAIRRATDLIQPR